MLIWLPIVAMPSTAKAASTHIITASTFKIFASAFSPLYCGPPSVFRVLIAVSRHTNGNSAPAQYTNPTTASRPP